MRLIIMGAPGSGKGTQAKMLCKEHNLIHISSGDLLRQEVKADTNLGELANSYMNAGDLVPDSIMTEIVFNKIKKVEDNFILDGFPRVVSQVWEMDINQIKVDFIFNILVSDKIIIDRLVNRRVCETCGEIYHLISKKPAREGRCDNCGGNLLHRNDDQIETIENRLKIYHQNMPDIVGYFNKFAQVRNIVGNDKLVPVIFGEMNSYLQKAFYE